MDRQSSFILKLPVIMKTLDERKAELSEKKQQLLEARRLGGDCEQLDFEWGILEKEIDLLEHTAHVMKTDLIQRGLLVADDMKTQNMVLVDGKV